MRHFKDLIDKHKAYSGGGEYGFFGIVFQEDDKLEIEEFLKVLSV